jgi:hypothetical protein
MSLEGGEAAKDRLAFDARVEEYKALRAEVLFCLGARTTVLGLSLAAVGALWSASANALPHKSAGFDLAVTLPLLLAMVVPIAVWEIWHAEVFRGRRAAYRTWMLEKEMWGHLKRVTWAWEMLLHDDQDLATAEGSRFSWLREVQADTGLQEGVDGLVKRLKRALDPPPKESPVTAMRIRRTHHALTALLLFGVAGTSAEAALFSTNLNSLGVIWSGAFATVVFVLTALGWAIAVRRLNRELNGLARTPPKFTSVPVDGDGGPARAQPPSAPPPPTTDTTDNEASTRPSQTTGIPR